jgi:hypothetical protein
VTKFNPSYRPAEFRWESGFDLQLRKNQFARPLQRKLAEPIRQMMVQPDGGLESALKGLGVLLPGSIRRGIGQADDHAPNRTHDPRAALSVTGRFKLTHPGSLQNDPPWRG